MDHANLNERSHNNGSIGMVDGSRRVSSRSLSHTDSSSQMPSAQIVTVVVHKDENGYGMKVSGDNPVFVQSVRDGGAAEKAGLQAGDLIIKVNGDDVIKSTHTEVVALIRSFTHVKLTVKQHPRSMIRPIIGSPVPSHHQNSSRPLSTHHHTSSSTQITAPQPVDHEKLRQFENERVHLIRMMLEKEQTHVEALRSELARLPTNADSSKVISDLAVAERTVGKLQSELQTCLALTTPDGLSASSLSHTLPKSLTTSTSNLNQSVQLAGVPQSKSSNQLFSSSDLHTVPPPLPNRNKITTTNDNIFNSNRASSARFLSSERLDNHRNFYPRPFYQKSPSQSPPIGGVHVSECNLVENQLYHQSKLKEHQNLDKSDSILANYYKKNPLSPKNMSSGKHNKIAKRLKGSSNDSNNIGASSDNLSSNNSGVGVDTPPPLPPRIPLLAGDHQFFTDISNPVTSSSFSSSYAQQSTCTPTSGINESADAVNSINKQMSYPLVATCAALVNNSCNSKTPHIVNTHHRTNSSPDPLSLKHSPQDVHRLINSESMSDLTDIKSTRCDSWDIVERNSGCHITPPGTPPPPYPSPYQERSPNMIRRNVSGGCSQRSSGDHSDDIHEEPPPAFTDHPPENIGLLDVPIAISSTPIVAANSNVIQKHIISMEDEMSDQEVEPIEDGPFKSLSRLWEHLAHLAVFMNYILTNCDPSSILFYLITNLYKEGNAKDMKKWAYEIHSSFLIPGSPLRLKNVDENVAREIDDVLQKDADKEEILRKVFLKARAKAKEELNELLAEFRQKRNAGLGTLYGPCDSLLEESIHEKQVENKIIEEVLQKKLTPYLEDLDHEPVDPRKYTTAVALSTVFTRIFGLRLGHTDLERLPSFVSKDKSLRTKIIGRRGKLSSRGHHFVAHQYYTVNYCNHCQLLIWGIGPQAYRCSNCHSNIHRHCVKSFEENCPGPLVKKEKGAYPISKIMGRIRPDIRSDAKRKPNSHNFLHVEREKRLAEEKDNDADISFDRPQSTTSITRSGSDRRSDASEDNPEPETCDKETINENFPRLPRPKSTQTSINRSESYKEQSQKRRQIKERRKISDPNLSKSNDAEPDSGLSYNTNSGSSSNSSLSSAGPSLDSPSISFETVSSSANTNNARVRVLGDSDPETEVLLDPSDWTINVPEEVLARLTASEKKRQDVFNELVQTERSHVRQLRVLENVFHIPLETSNLLTTEFLSLLFPNLEQILEFHLCFSEDLKVLRKDNALVSEIGETLLKTFDGSSGDAFEKAISKFCARQHIALEKLREKRRKDAKLHNFLNDCEADKSCRRLQLKDLIPTEMQRLTKYPLLFENLAKYTSQCLMDCDNTTPNNNSSTMSNQELERLHRAVERSKEMLNSVNAAMKKAEDFQRLLDIQRRLDRSGFDKVDQPIVVEFRNIDITKRELIYEGPLYWRISNKRINLHVLLLDDVILLLQKQDDKFSLKFHYTTQPGSIDRPIVLSPIIRISTCLVRTNAADSNSLYLITTAQNGPHMYDLVASSPAEINKWIKYLTEATEACTKHEGGRHNRNSIENNDLINDAETSLHRDHMQTIDENSDNQVGKLEDDSEDNISMKSTDGNEQNQTPVTNITNSYQTSQSYTKDKDKPVTNLDSPTSSTSSPSINIPGIQSSLLLSTEQNTLIEPSEVTVSFKPVLTAEPVLTPLERLRRTDLTVKNALTEKQLLVADILNVPRDEFVHIAEVAAEPTNDKDATELLLAAVNQANQLAEAINETLNITEEQAIALTAIPPPPIHTSTPVSNIGNCSWSAASRLHNRIPGVSPQRLQNISSTLNLQLTQLLKVIKERDEEREKLRSELHKAREQVHILHELHQTHKSNEQVAPQPVEAVNNDCLTTSNVTISNHSSSNELLIPLEPSVTETINHEHTENTDNELNTRLEESTIEI